MPSPGLVLVDGAPIPASYMNFYIGNAAVVVPLYGAENDAAAVAAIQAIYAHHVRHGTASFDTVPPTVQDWEAKISAILAKGWPFLVADASGVVAGYAYASQFRDRTAYRATCEDSIYVAADAHRSGAGRVCVQHHRIRPRRPAQRDWRQPYLASEGVESAWLQVYRDPQQHWDLYQLGEELTDLEDAFRLWRFRHVTTVERVIGFKRGTGGTGGVNYLRKMLDVVLFPEIWTLRTQL